MIRYRIRIGRQSYADPHYVTKVGDQPNFTSIVVNKNPCSWKKLSTAQKHFEQIKVIYPSAEIEPYIAGDL
ncbi:hypothetical protein DDO73_13915 [Vibrio cholerae]|nr:hypothetical protein [Vibrio cholerae]MVC37367.1 hypothetical protein [Vibrio cholerae]